MYSHSRNRVTVNKDALRHNYTILKNGLGSGVELLAMVKADAYGHGMIESAKAFVEAGCSTLGVAEIGEGVELRKAGIEANILIFIGCQQDEYELLFKYDLTPLVYLQEDLRNISALGERRGEMLRLHLKVDTGMGRLGVFPKDVPEMVKLIENLPNIKLAGVVSHLARGDEPEETSNQEAFKQFELATSDMVSNELTFHLANSAGVLNFPEVHYSFSRAGISLYGYYPDGGCGDRYEHQPRLQPAMSFRTSVLQVKKFPAGKGISYGHTYTTSRETVLAVLPVGYEDGVSRSLSNCGEVLIHGKRAGICGRVCMNLCMVDVTDIDNVQPGDEVVILGTQGDETITADEIGSRCDTISYEVLCMIGNNNKREYLVNK